MLRLVGAYGDDDTKGRDAGAAFVFTKTSLILSSSWTQTTRLLADSGTRDDKFGKSVSISKDASTIAVDANWVDSKSGLAFGVSLLVHQFNDDIGMDASGKICGGRWRNIYQYGGIFYCR
jgi:hypothetical protein